MSDVWTYRLELRGEIGDGDINLWSPLQVTIERADACSTLLTFRTDQSGLIGLMRHLHGLGFMFLSLTASCYREKREQ